MPWAYPAKPRNNGSAIVTEKAAAQIPLEARNGRGRYDHRRAKVPYSPSEKGQGPVSFDLRGGSRITARQMIGDAGVTCRRTTADVEP